MLCQVVQNFSSIVPCYARLCTSILFSAPKTPSSTIPTGLPLPVSARPSSLPRITADSHRIGRVQLPTFLSSVSLSAGASDGNHDRGTSILFSAPKTPSSTIPTGLPLPVSARPSSLPRITADSHRIGRVQLPTFLSSGPASVLELQMGTMTEALFDPLQCTQDGRLPQFLLDYHCQLVLAHLLSLGSQQTVTESGGYSCLRFSRRSASVLELQMGTMTEAHFDPLQCTQDAVFHNSY
jgi:hypothetical protein